MSLHKDHNGSPTLTALAKRQEKMKQQVWDDVMRAKVKDLEARLALAGEYLQEICDHGAEWGGTACSAHAFLALGNAINPRKTA